MLAAGAGLGLTFAAGLGPRLVCAAELGAGAAWAAGLGEAAAVPAGLAATGATPTLVAGLGAGGAAAGTDLAVVGRAAGALAGPEDVQARSKPEKTITRLKTVKDRVLLTDGLTFQRCQRDRCRCRV